MTKNNGIQTKRHVAVKASRALRSEKTSRSTKSIAGSALRNTAKRT